MKLYEYLEGRWVNHYPVARHQDCLVTGLVAVTNGLGICSPQYHKLNQAVRKRGYGLEAVSLWNDAPGRTWEEVKALLKELDI
jgi:hypothetical protein